MRPDLDLDGHGERAKLAVDTIIAKANAEARRRAIERGECTGTRPSTRVGLTEPIRVGDIKAFDRAVSIVATTFGREDRR